MSTTDDFKVLFSDHDLRIVEEPVWTAGEHDAGEIHRVETHYGPPDAEGLRPVLRRRWLR